ncbi:TatD family hydrolase [Rhodoferax bucti]|uniref:TatD family hydrolase n=1 Tax=Rhodoferax bucti TaxID=2576305 RepID=UPI001107F58A|nr:TatD family hydrolase [Rhodoferax bucti]
MRWIDTHVHLDAGSFDADRNVVRQQARAAGVAHCVIPAVERSNFDTVRLLAHAGGDSYGLGIHPLYVAGAEDADLAALDEALTLHHADPRLVAVGEIGLDYFVPALCKSPLRERQEVVYRQQLKLARKHDLPVMLHVRKSSDRVLKHLREVAGPGGRWRGIAHAFNGSEVQAAEFIKLGFKLGFGGAVTFDRALQLRHLAKTLPLDALVLETDAPDIPPHWLYTTAEQRAAGMEQGRNTPAELPRIAECVATLRGISVDALATAALHNSLQALPKLGALLV